jgi:predicted Zn-dependent peptidase
MKSASYDFLTLPGGLRLAVAVLPHTECAALSIHVPAGSRHDEAGLSGTAHFVEHMVFKGTPRRDSRAISLEMEDAGASLNACTTEDQITYEARGEAESLPLLADVTADITWNALISQSDIEMEREVIREEITMYRESPGDHIADLLSAALWSPHPLGDSVSGTEESLDRIQREALVKFRDRHHFRSDCVIAVASPLSAQQVADILSPHLPGSLQARVPTPSLGLGDLGAPQHLIDERDTDQLQLALGWRTPGRNDPRRHALRLLAMILGESAGSRLFQELREKRGLCYHVSCDADFFEDVGSFEIHTGLAPKGRGQALDCIRRELEDIQKNGPRADELARAKRLAVSQTKMALESTASHASWVGDCLLHYDRMIHPTEVRAIWEKISIEDVQAVASELLPYGAHAMAEIKPE